VRQGWTAEAVRLARLLAALLPQNGEVAELRALMLLHWSSGCPRL
jgi:RNA polymerase sigma-70 factor, ECF subfamily